MLKKSCLIAIAQWTLPQRSRIKTPLVPIPQCDGIYTICSGLIGPGTVGGIPPQVQPGIKLRRSKG